MCLFASIYICINANWPGHCDRALIYPLSECRKGEGGAAEVRWRREGGDAAY